MDAHLKLHGEKWAMEEMRKCKLCNKQFSQPALYRLHIREHYRVRLLSMISMSCNYDYRDDVCIVYILISCRQK